MGKPYGDADEGVRMDGTVAKLVRWDVPFAGAFYPSVTATFITATVISPGTMAITISAGDGTQFRVESELVLAFTCLDESCTPRRWFSTVETEQVETVPIIV